MVGHNVKCKNTFLELDLPPADLRRVVTSPGRVGDEEAPQLDTPTLLARRGLPPLRHLCSPFSLEESVGVDRSEDGDNSTDEELPGHVEEERYKAHFVGLAEQGSQKVNFGGLFAELRALRRSQVGEAKPAAKVEHVKWAESPTSSGDEGAGVAEAPKTVQKSWADLNSDDEESDEESVLEAPKPVKKSWADMTSDDEESDEESVLEVPKPVKKSWADMTSDDEESGEESVLEAPKPVKKSWADITSDDEESGEESVLEAPKPVKKSWADMTSDDESVGETQSVQSKSSRSSRSTVTWAQPVAFAEAPVAFRPGTPRQTQAVSALAEIARQAEDDGWTTVQKKERKSGPAQSWAEMVRTQPAQKSWAEMVRTQPARPAQRPANTRPPANTRARPATGTEKIMVNLEDSPEFPVVRRLIGVGGANLRRIGDACDTTVQLRGRGCGGTGPLHLVISGPADRLPAACRQAHTLVEDVRAQFARATRAR